MLAKVLTKAGAAVRARDIMYKAVVQTMLLYASESWVDTGAMLTVLEGFHHWVAIQIAVNKAWHAGDNGWE